MSYLGTPKKIEAEAWRLAILSLDQGRDGRTQFKNQHYDLIVDLVAMEESEEFADVISKVEAMTKSNYDDDASAAYVLLELVRQKAYVIVREVLEDVLDLPLCGKCKSFKIMERICENPDLCNDCFDKVDERFYAAVTEAKMAAFRAHWSSLTRSARSLECDELEKPRCGPDDDPDCDVIEAIGRRDLGWDS